MNKIKLQYDEKIFLKGKILYENEFYNEDLFIEMFFRKAMKRIVIIDRNIESSMLDKLIYVKKNISITIYTSLSPNLSNKKIDMLKETHNLKFRIRDKILCKVLAIDNELYLLSKAKNPRGIMQFYDYTIEKIIDTL